MNTRIFTLLIAFLAMVGNAVWGQTNETGDFMVSKGNATYKDGVLTISGDATVSNANPSTDDRIVINGGREGSPVNVTLDGVNIKIEDANRWPVKIASGSFVNLILKNENTIESPDENNGTAATRGILWLEGDEDTNAFSTLTIKGDGKLKIIVNSGINAIGGINSRINIESGTIEATKGGIGGQNSTVNISGGEITMDTESSNWGCIGGGDVSKVTISDGAKIHLKNPRNGIFANKIEISGGTLDITYESDYTENNAGNGIVCRGCKEPDTQGTFSMTGGTYTITDNRNSKKATGISANQASASQPVITTLSNCIIKMDVREGISDQGRGHDLKIKDNAVVDILSTQTPIDVESVDISTKSLVTVKSTGSSRHGIQDGMTTGENGNAYVVSDTDLGIDEDNRENWKGIILEGNKEDDFVNGYVYGNITLDRDFELKENYHLIYCEPTDLTIGEYKIINNGAVCIANEYEKKGVEVKIDEGNGNGAYYYQIFYEEESLDIPYSLKEKMESRKHMIGDIIVSIDNIDESSSEITDELLHKKTHPLNTQESNMAFGKSQANITLGLDTRIKYNYKTVYDSYVIKSFDVKTMDGEVIAEGVTSFTMPDEAVVICNLKIEGAYKLSYELVGENTEGLQVQFKDQKQTVIESAAYDDLVYIFISAPGYENFSVSEVTAKYTDDGKDINNSIHPVKYADDNYIVKAFDSMPKGDVTIVVSGEATNPIPYQVSIDESIQNGTVTATINGEDATQKTVNVADEIIVTATPNNGYELKSLQYKDDNGTLVDITNYDEEAGTYSFLMPASNVTITATFGPPESSEEPGDDDNPDNDTPDDIHHPQRPIKYYNIYVDTICPGLDVETSKDVVAEGHQVSAYLTIQAECDTTGMRFEYKRGLFGYWQDLKELEGVQPGEYIIKNIYTDIYIRAPDATLPEEEPTGLDDLEGIQAYAKEGSIYVYTPNREEVTIVSMSGAILKHEEQVGWQSYAVNRGIYIVRVGEKVFKLKN